MEKTYPKYRWVIAVLYLLASALGMLLVSAVSPIMGSMQEAFGTDAATIGYASTLVTAFCGVFTFFGVVVLGKWSLKQSYVIGSAIYVLGCGMCMLAPSVSILLIGRSITGIGYGIVGALGPATIYMWFPPKERPSLFTLNSFATSGMQLIAYNIFVPIFNINGKWQSVFVFCFAVSAVVALGWLILGKEFDINADPNAAPVKKEKKSTGNPLAPLRLAFANKELWYVAIPTTMLTLAYMTISFYYPNFLIQQNGFSQQAASSITSVLFGAALAGSMIGGSLCTALGKRKILMIASCIGCTVTLFVLFTVKSVPVLIATMVVYGICTAMKTPVALTAATEVKGMTPAMSGGINGMLFGFGSLFTIVLPSVLNALYGAVGMSMGMIIFCSGVSVVGLIFALLMVDRGPKAKAAAEK